MTDKTELTKLIDELDNSSTRRLEMEAKNLIRQQQDEKREGYNLRKFKKMYFEITGRNNYKPPIEYTDKELFDLLSLLYEAILELRDQVLDTD